MLYRRLPRVDAGVILFCPLAGLLRYGYFRHQSPVLFLVVWQNVTLELSGKRLDRTGLYRVSVSTVDSTRFKSSKDAPVVHQKKGGVEAVKLFVLVERERLDGPWRHGRRSRYVGGDESGRQWVLVPYALKGNQILWIDANVCKQLGLLGFYCKNSDPKDHVRTRGELERKEGAAWCGRHCGPRTTRVVLV